MGSREVPAARKGPRPLQGRDEDLAGLLADVAQGDETAFEAAYDRLARPVYGLIRKVVRDPVHAENVVHGPDQQGCLPAVRS
jgi:hypothetical protein